MATVAKNQVYFINGLNIQCSLSFSDFKKTWVVSGSVRSKLECGGSSNVKEIKGCMKKFMADNNLSSDNKITHSIYGIYAVDVNA